MTKEEVLVTEMINSDPVIDLNLLATRIASGDRNAEAEIVLVFSDYLLTFISRKLNEREMHDDIYQETILRVLIKLRAGEVLNPQALKSYVLTTANHLIYRVINQRNIRLNNVTDTDVESVSELDEAGFESFADADDNKLLYSAIEQLKTARDRHLMSAILIEHKEKKEVCVLLGVSGTQFDRILSRAKVRLIEQVGILSH